MKSPSAVSKQWGSYFVDVHRSEGGDEENQKLTWCCNCIHKYSTMAIPSVEHIAGMWKQTTRLTKLHSVTDVQWFDGEKKTGPYNNEMTGSKQTTSIWMLDKKHSP